MAPRLRDRIKNTLLWRGALTYLQGPLIVLSCLSGVYFLDPVAWGLHPGSLAVYAVYYVFIMYFCSYMLNSGRWTFLKWSRTLPALSMPLLLFYGHISALMPQYSILIVPLLVLSAGLPMLAVLDRKYYIWWAVLFAVGFLGTGFLLNADYFHNHVFWAAIVVIVVFVFQFWIRTASDYGKTLNNKLARQLGEMRKARNRISQLAAELTQRNRRIESDLEMARRVQEGILPRGDSIPVDPRLSLAAHYEALDSVGGDFYDIARLGENRISFLVADVSGHGVAAALVASMAGVAFARLREDEAPGRTLTRLNSELYRYLGQQSHYITAVYCVLNLDSGQLDFSIAGHPSPFLYQRSSKALVELQQDSTFFLGIEPHFDFPTSQVQMADGDRLLLYSDGLTEVQRDSVFYGQDRFPAYIRESSGLDADGALRALLGDVSAFARPQALEDDITLIVADYSASASARLRLVRPG